MNNMQIIAVSDIYGDFDSVETLIGKLNDQHVSNRIIIIAGDIGFAKDDGNYEKNVDQILKYFASVAALVVFIPGDSDKREIVSSHKNILNVDGQNYITMIGGITVGIFGQIGRASCRERV